MVAAHFMKVGNAYGTLTRDLCLEKESRIKLYPDLNSLTKRPSRTRIARTNQLYHL